ncbi:MAG: DUF4058 family protein [Saprospiraceae bacterium]|nr:DUF4058 family protein [Saprospiraceae bacterium]
MSSPFPGMDPYLEGHLFPDVHNSLAYLIKVQLVLRLSPNYIVHLNNYTVEDTSPTEDVGIMYPDVEVFHKVEMLREPESAYYALALTPETAVLPELKPVEVQIPVVEIRDRKHNQLVTAIEILSPVNKRNPGLQPYREKRDRLHKAGVHLVEIDLLRRGERPLKHPKLPKSHYLVTLVRAGSGSTQVWAMSMKDPLPVIPIPLRQPDEDTVLDIGKALKDLYEQGAFWKSIDYSETSPPPAFTPEETAWMAERIAEWKNI